MHIRCYPLLSANGSRLIVGPLAKPGLPTSAFSWDVLSASARGARHVKEERPNQDAAGTALYSLPADGAVIVAADGHGSPEYVRADVGSQLACNAAIEWAVKFLAARGSSSTLTCALQGQLLSQRIHDAWLTAVRGDLTQRPLTPSEWKRIPERQRRRLADHPETAYGSTLLTAIVWNAGLMALQLGDGDIVDGSGGGVRRLIEPQEGVSSLTDSLCDLGAVDKFRIHVDSFAAGAPECVMVRTDGWMNSFENDADRERADVELFRWLRSAGKETVEADLESLLAETSASGWSQGDDVSCAMLFRQEGGSHVS